MKRHLGIEVDKSSLEYICEDDGGKSQWFFDAGAKEYLCISTKGNTFSYQVPLNDFAQLRFRKMQQAVRSGLQAEKPIDEIRSKAALKSNAVNILCNHAEAIKAKEGK